MKNNNILRYILNKKSDLIKLILGAFILALGSSLLANYLTDLFSNNKTYILILSISLVFVAIIYFVYSLLKDTKNSIIIESIIAIDPKEKIVYPIPRFEFSENLNHTLKAAFLENEALKKYWEDDFQSNKINDQDDKNINDSDEKKESDVKYFSIIRMQKEDGINKQEKKSEIVLEEAIEHVILELLSAHLSVFFNNYSNEDQLITELTRKDIPEILLKNRVMNLLSTPFEDRAIFVKAGMTNQPNDGEVVSILGSDGSKFERFDLILPTGSKVSRPKRCEIEIDNKRINFKIEIINEGFNSSLPKGFEANYLGVTDRDLRIRKIDIVLTYNIKNLYLLSSSKWNYHDWIDSFAERLEEFASIDKFVKTINWDTNLTSIITDYQRRSIYKKIEEEKRILTKPKSQSLDKDKNEAI